MIKHVGIGVAMENVEKVVKESANFVTDTNMNEDIVKYLKNIFSKNRIQIKNFYIIIV